MTVLRFFSIAFSISLMLISFGIMVSSHQKTSNYFEQSLKNNVEIPWDQVFILFLSWVIPFLLGFAILYLSTRNESKRKLKIRCDKDIKEI